METIPLLRKPRAQVWSSPYLLGKSIEWKLLFKQLGEVFFFPSPYLLGKSIEWKRDGCNLLAQEYPGPYLLGKSIEWKHHFLQ